MRSSKILATLVLLVAAVALAFGVQHRIRQEAGSAEASETDVVAPVEVAPIERGELVERRTFSGALESRAEFVVASKVSGRVERIEVDLADPVQRGGVVVRLDDDEHVQAVNQQQAELELAQANLGAGRSALEIAQRNLQRTKSLKERGVSSESQLDAALADELAQRARVDVARAEIARAEAALETARIQLAYTQVTADWAGGDDERIVAQRFVDEGETVPANEALLSIVELDPISGVFYVPERDYSSLSQGQPVSLTTEAWPGERFEGTIERIAPVFSQNTRQARVELEIRNTDHRLKPGMFIRATVELARATGATIVPEAALTERGDQEGVFVVTEDGRSVRWCPVTVGIREQGRVQIDGEGLVGLVVTLGQQLIEDGSAIVVPGAPGEPAGRGGAAASGGASQ